MTEQQIRELDFYNKILGRDLVRQVVIEVGVLQAVNFIRYSRLVCPES